MSPFQTLIRELQAIRADWSQLHCRYSSAGFETRTIPSEYYWNGLKRDISPANPCVLFQYTLDGWGCFVEGGVNHRVMPGMLFTAVIPSDHSYYLPQASPCWVFFWVMIRHPYIVSRIAQRGKRLNSVVTIAPDDVPVQRLLSILKDSYCGGFGDVLDEERSLFNLLIEYERYAERLERSYTEREQLLSEVHSYVRQFLGRSIQINELGNIYGMSRSNFSHYFKTVTGLTPANFVTQVRLDEAAGLLLQSDLKLEAIARNTGFASANHFCRVFRTHFSMSPNDFRRQMRSDFSQRQQLEWDPCASNQHMGQ